LIKGSINDGEDTMLNSLATVSHSSSGEFGKILLEFIRAAISGKTCRRGISSGDLGGIENSLMSSLLANQSFTARHV